ncbi:response regulator [Pseudocnuella soli]|uniref:response regulator n=1 Tax=Pseudocnuella soli TaxID=2502779 RepID=UPI0010497C4D|nr:response regulator [Pseudocnuella soli]
MNQSKQPIIVVEDDAEDREILKEVLESLKLPFPVKYFDEGRAVLDYLRTTKDHPFIILTDVNMSGMNGIRLREEIMKDEALRVKSIPFVFVSTSDGKDMLHKIYDLQVQGYFEKPNTLSGMKTQLSLIIQYWMECRHPNQVK